MRWTPPSDGTRSILTVPAACAVSFSDTFVRRLFSSYASKQRLKGALYGHPLALSLNMLPYSSGYSTSASSSSSPHFHASLPSHLSTELALLQTFIKRASAQHRSQLFLQRMEGVVRIGKAMMLHVRKIPEERRGEACIAWRGKGENLVKKVGRYCHNTNSGSPCWQPVDDQNALQCSVHHFTDHRSIPLPASANHCLIYLC